MRVLVMATRGGEAEDAEPVVIDTDTPGAVVLELDDGARLELDRVELEGALRRAA